MKCPCKKKIESKSNEQRLKGKSEKMENDEEENYNANDRLETI